MDRNCDSFRQKTRNIWQNGKRKEGIRFRFVKTDADILAVLFFYFKTFNFVF